MLKGLRIIRKMCLLKLCCPIHTIYHLNRFSPRYVPEKLIFGPWAVLFMNFVPSSLPLSIPISSKGSNLSKRLGSKRFLNILLSWIESFSGVWKRVVKIDPLYTNFSPVLKLTFAFEKGGTWRKNMIWFTTRNVCQKSKKSCWLLKMRFSLKGCCWKEQRKLRKCRARWWRCVVRRTATCLLKIWVVIWRKLYDLLNL